LSVRLAFDPVSAEASTRVAGKLSGRAVAAQLEVKVDAEGGVWTSGWQPVGEGFFETAVVLQEGRLNRFTLSRARLEGARARRRAFRVSIRHGLSLDAPPLPHTISVELSHADGRVELSPVFPRRTLLPAERTVTYRAAHTLAPERARHFARD
jgi:hypothetical protein